MTFTHRSSTTAFAASISFSSVGCNSKYDYDWKPAALGGLRLHSGIIAGDHCLQCCPAITSTRTTATCQPTTARTTTHATRTTTRTTARTTTHAAPTSSAASRTGWLVEIRRRQRQHCG
jgi:hypothetical protein